MQPHSLLLLFVALIGLLALACSEGDVVVQPSDVGPSGVSATGTGMVAGEAHVAVITVGVERDSVLEARETAASTEAAVIESLKDNGVDEADVQTIRFSVQPRFDFNSVDDLPRISGYIVDNVVSARISDIDSTGQALDDAIAGGGDDAVVQGVSFTIDDPSELRAEARRMAVEQAREQAEQLASADGVELGPLLSISEGGGAIPFPANFAGGDALGIAAAESPIQAGELQISVTLFYALKQ